MTDLNNETNQLVIIKAILNNHRKLHSFWQGKSSIELIQFLQSDSLISKKWEKIQAFRASPEPNRLTRIINQIIEEASLPTRYITNFKVNRYSLKDLDLFTDASKRAIINYLKEEFVGLASFENLRLFITLNDKVVTPKDKWDAIKTFLQNENNNKTRYYWLVYETLANHNINEDYKARADDACRSENYFVAIDELSRIEPKDDTVFSKLGYCHNKLQQYTQAYLNDEKAYRHLKSDLHEELTEGNLNCRKKKYRKNKTLSLHNAVTSDHSNFLDSVSLHSEKEYDYQHFKKAFQKDFFNGLSPGIVLTAASIKYSSYIIPMMLAMVGVGFMGVGAVVGSFNGTVHGLFRASTRKPIGVEQQKKVIESLHVLTESNDERKTEVIRKIVKAYKKNQTLASSDSSQYLFAILSNSKKSTTEKLQALNAYMLDMSDGFVKNNGKKLYRIIEKELSPINISELDCFRSVKSN